MFKIKGITNTPYQTIFQFYTREDARAYLSYLYKYNRKTYLKCNGYYDANGVKHNKIEDKIHISYDELDRIEHYYIYY